MSRLRPTILAALAGLLLATSASSRPKGSFEAVAESGTAEEMRELMKVHVPVHGALVLDAAIKAGNVEVVKVLLDARYWSVSCYRLAARAPRKLEILPLLLARRIFPSDGDYAALVHPYDREVVALLAEQLPPDKLALALLHSDPKAPLGLLSASVDRELRGRGSQVDRRVEIRLLALGADREFSRLQWAGDPFDPFAVDDDGNNGLEAALASEKPPRPGLIELYLRILPDDQETRADGRTRLHDAAALPNETALAALRRFGYQDQPDAGGRWPADELWTGYQTEQPQFLERELGKSGLEYRPPTTARANPYFRCHGKAEAWECTGELQDRALEKPFFTYRVETRRSGFRGFRQLLAELGLPVGWTSIGDPSPPTAIDDGTRQSTTVEGAVGPYLVKVEAKASLGLEPELSKLGEMAIGGITYRTKLKSPLFRLVGPLALLVLLVVGFTLVSHYRWRRQATGRQPSPNPGPRRPPPRRT